MNGLRAWVHEKPWHQYLLIALTLGLLIIAYRQLKKGGSSSGPFVGQTSSGMIDNAQYDELRNELAALQSYVNNPTTPNAPTSSGPTSGGGGIGPAGGGVGLTGPTGRDPLGGKGGWFTLPSAMSVETLARFFHLQQGSSGAPNEEWTRIAYNPNNAGILPDSYAAHGNNVLAAGTSVYIDPTAYDQSDFLPPMHWPSDPVGGTH